MKTVERISVLFMAVLLIAGLTACGKKSDVIYTLNGTTIDKKDVDIFGFIYVMEHSLVDSDKLNDIYDEGETYSEHYKNDLEKEIVLSVLLSKEADDNKVVLSSEDKEEAETKTEQLLSKFGESAFKEKNITKNDILKIYEMKLRANSYAGSIGDEYSDVLDKASDDNESQGGNESDDVADNGSEENDNGISVDINEDDRYIRVFQVTFPTVILDDSGMIKTDKNGELIRISSEEIDEMKSAAEQFSENVRAGEDIEVLLKNEPVNVKGVERTLKYSDLSKEYKSAVDSLSKNEVSTVISGEYGYYVVKLLEENDEEHAENIKNYEKQVIVRNAKNELYEKLLNTYVGSDKGYRKDELWNEISIRTYMQ